MIERNFEPFLLVAVEQPFRGVISWIPQDETDELGVTRHISAPVLLHTLTAALRPGDVVQRMCTGEMYRVTTVPEVFHTPKALPFAQCAVERSEDDD